LQQLHICKECFSYSVKSVFCAFTHLPLSVKAVYILCFNAELLPLPLTKPKINKIYFLFHLSIYSHTAVFLSWRNVHIHYCVQLQ
jgi:hypothetical protein